ncbi:DUF72 domain-containing protein [Panacibacter ginsenosidivorans]|uniref:DUF72 domain-containing protein n=1 Tax=Panacibacter ginsenosidivorans TaxID=1813871 RepID=A0A5B8VAE8_9BACT|nr:DUF72 domain-containing protein [Panacibacter ginsenosidivorans]QEC67841.1 DUF72 domain-containing protein [Panacibacter ginsenosidivorans]
MQWCIGCSGFSYKEWKGNFYPQKLPQTRWFEYYSTHFNTLELNVTFYRFPQLKIMENWFAKSPEDFLFAVKAPRLITHYKKFNDCQQLLSDFYTTISKGLKNKLGPVLFQLPPQIKYDEIFLQKLIYSVDNSFNNVIEFRHSGWWRQDVYDILKKHGITFCGINHPQLPADVITNTPLVYYRFHGAPKLYYDEYAKADITTMANDILSSKRAKDVFVFFNNTATMAAINNANQLKQYIATNR